MTTIICMWSGPRNLSTAMMRSFGSRQDTAVWDEPFFAPFLLATGKDHPGRDETLKAHETDAHIVAELCTAPPSKGEAYYFQKHMPHHMMPDFPTDWIRSARHFFLIRQPARVIASYVKGRETFDIDDLGFAPQRWFFDIITQQCGVSPTIIDCDDILIDPAGYLNVLCEALGITYDSAMLKWAPGPRPEDGAWAPFWYETVYKSTGFAPHPGPLPILPNHLRSVFEACLPDYEFLYDQRLHVKLPG